MSLAPLEPRALLRRMVEIPSVSGSEETLVRELVARCNAAGFQAHRDEVGNLVAVRGSGRPHGILLGHVDTVPGLPRVYDDGAALHGRGAVDAKGPLAAFLSAVDRLAQVGGLPGTVTVIGCVEEEVSSSRGARHAVHRDPPDYCIVGEPSGVDAMTLGYKGYLAIEARFAVTKGHGAHDRISAAEAACEGWSKIRAAFTADYEHHPRLFDRVLPTLASIVSHDDGLLEQTVARIHLRLPGRLDPTAAQTMVSRLLPDAELSVMGAVPAWSGPRTSNLARALHRSIQAEGSRPRYLHKTGTADLNIVAPVWRCPALAYGPGDAALDHTPLEHVTWQDYQLSIAILARVLREAPEWLADSDSALG